MPGPSYPTSLWRIHPETGELLFADSPPYPRSIVIDSSGTTIVPSYLHTGPGGITSLWTASKAWQDANFNSIRNLVRPLTFTNGGNPYTDAIYGSGSISLTYTSSTAMVESNFGATTVFTGPIINNGVIIVSDIGGNAATNHITVNAGGHSLENPAAPGSFASSITLSTNYQTVAWIYDTVNGRYKFLFANGGGTGGIFVDQGGADIGGNPHTVLNFTGNGVVASDAGGGVATINVPAIGVATGYVLVGNANPSTGNLSPTVLQAIVDTSVATTTVNAPDLFPSTPFIQQLFRVTDDTAHAATYPITITSGQPVEDPNNHGTYATSVMITVNSQSIDWQWTGSHWKIV